MIEQNHEQVDSDSCFHYGKYYVNHCFSIVWQPSTEHCQKKVWWIYIAHIKIKGKHFIAHVNYNPGGLFRISNKLTVTVSLWKILWKSLFSIVWQPSTEHCLKMLMDLDCPYQTWGKTLYCTCQTYFWMHFPKIQISWQWQLHYVKCSINHCFSIVWQPSIKKCLNCWWC